MKLWGKVKKVTVPVADNHKFNEILEEMSDDDIIDDEDEALDNNENSNNEDGME